MKLVRKVCSYLYFRMIAYKKEGPIDGSCRRVMTLVNELSSKLTKVTKLNVIEWVFFFFFFLQT